MLNMELNVKLEDEDAPEVSPGVNPFKLVIARGSIQKILKSTESLFVSIDDVKIYSGEDTALEEPIDIEAFVFERNQDYLVVVESQTYSLEGITYELSIAPTVIINGYSITPVEGHVGWFVIRFLDDFVEEAAILKCKMIKDNFKSEKILSLTLAAPSGGGPV